jgi:hypothetical protein
MCQRLTLVLIIVFLLNALSLGQLARADALVADQPALSGSLRAVGNRVLLANGLPYIPRGISIYGGLEDTDYSENIPNLKAQIKAAADYWHTNTIRLQIAESNLFSHITSGKTYNVNFLKLLINLVDYARSFNQVVVINDQTEFTTNLPAPTAQTLKFWRIIGNTFGNKPYIVFDLFNEPRLSVKVGKSYPVLDQLSGNFQPLKLFLRHRYVRRKTKSAANLTWKLWEYGGTLNGVRYIGMQTLVNQIRDRGINNLIWIEGPNWAGALPSKSRFLSGNNLEYAYHHVNLNLPSSWTRIAVLAQTKPVVDGEWAQYESPWEECFSSAPKTVPLYLNFLLANHIGLVAWSLQPGSLLKGLPRLVPANNNSPQDTRSANQLQTPNRFLGHYACSDHFGQGSGALIKQYFADNPAPI